VRLVTLSILSFLSTNHQPGSNLSNLIHVLSKHALQFLTTLFRRYFFIALTILWGRFFFFSLVATAKKCLSSFLFRVFFIIFYRLLSSFIVCCRLLSSFIVFYRVFFSVRFFFLRVISIFLLTTLYQFCIFCRVHFPKILMESVRHLALALIRSCIGQGWPKPNFWVKTEITRNPRTITAGLCDFSRKLRLKLRLLKQL